MSQLFAWGGQSIGVFCFSISLSSGHPGLISFRIDWLDLLAVQGTLKSVLQHHSSKASIFQHSAFFTVQLSHPYMTTGKTMALTRWTSVGKVMSLLFNMLSRLVITFLPRSKRLLISWLRSLSAVILVLLVHMFQPQSPNSPPPLIPLGIHLFDLYVCVTISVLQMKSPTPFFYIPHMCVNIWYFLFLTYFILYDTLGPSTSLQMTQFHSFLLLSRMELHSSLRSFCLILI